jgi:alanine racemase
MDHMGALAIARLSDSQTAQKNTWVEVDLRVLADNARRILSELRPETALVCVVKANAYGHGMMQVARTAARQGVKWFAVAHVHEASRLREALDEDVSIVVLGVADAGDVPLLLQKQIIPIVVSDEHAAALSAEAAHLKIDTGMGRLGVPHEQAVALMDRISKWPGIDVAGVCTHLASIELKKPSLGPTQVERFLGVVRELEQRGFRKLFKHVASSRGIQYHLDWDLDGVRPGIIVYGYGAGEKDMRIRTLPILQWKTRVMQAKSVPAHTPIGYYSTYTTSAPTTIATLGAGYADGYHRALSNKGFVLIGGRRCPVVGRVSMNWITVDVGPDLKVRSGDEAVLIGRQGGESIWADELARLARTIPYEILTSINPMIERIYKD